MQTDVDMDVDGDERASSTVDDETGLESEASTPWEGIQTGRDSSIQDILLSIFDTQDRDGRSPRGITIMDINHLLGGASAGLGRRFRARYDDDDDEDDDEYSSILTFPEVTEPQKAGTQLLMSGEFGRVGSKIKSRANDINIAKYFNKRSTRLRQTPYKEDLIGNMVPNSNGVAVASYRSNIYSGQFSADSTFYYTCAQDFRLRVYDMTAPLTEVPSRASAATYNPENDYDHESKMKLRNSIQGHEGGWTITDSHLSPDNERMIYATLSPTVYMTSTFESFPTQIPIPFADPRARRDLWGYSESFGIYSCRFSADGNEVVAGGRGKIFVYDLLANQRTVKIAAHSHDVNSCCWADTTSGNVLVSASDDTFLKVWDRRSLGSSRKPSGVLVGHIEGITNVSAKGDGRYIISNGKDQALRLWDLRKMCSSADFEKIADDNYGDHNFDYRHGRYKPRRAAHPQDCSVMTYRGHSVLRTLIRCHFSPAETTGGQYLYSGSADGRIHIWSLDGRVVQVLDRAWTPPLWSNSSDVEPTGGGRHNVCVRDVSWHSQEPVIMSAGWQTGTGGSIIARHEWKGLSKRPGALEDRVEKEAQEKVDLSRRYHSRQTRRRHHQVPGAFESDSEDLE